MATKYAHTNIVSQNAERLADFYIRFFDCIQDKPPGQLTGDWLEKGTGVPDAKIKSIDLVLPGYGSVGPVLEIFEYSEVKGIENKSQSNMIGLRHLAFKVDDVAKVLENTIRNGGRKIRDLVRKEFKNGTFTYVYATDPEGNIIEIQSWKSK